MGNLPISSGLIRPVLLFAFGQGYRATGMRNLDTYLTWMDYPMQQIDRSLYQKSSDLSALRVCAGLLKQLCIGCKLRRCVYIYAIHNTTS